MSYVDMLWKGSRTLRSGIHHLSKRPGALRTLALESVWSRVLFLADGNGQLVWVSEDQQPLLLKDPVHILCGLGLPLGEVTLLRCPGVLGDGGIPRWQKPSGVFHCQRQGGACVVMSRKMGVARML